MRAMAPVPARRPPEPIWHGAADRTVAAADAEALEVDVHGLDFRRMVIQPFGAQSRCLWHDVPGWMRRWTTAGLGCGKPSSPTASDPYRRLGEVSGFMPKSKTGSTWLTA